MNPATKLLVLWLTPGVPPPGPFGAEAPSMSVYNEFFQRVKARTVNAFQLQKAWNLWYNGLDWFEKNVGSPHTLRDAYSRVIAFKTMNGETQFGNDAPRQTIRLGDTGPTVAQWQGVLKIQQTGVFDTATLEATKNYQLGRGLKADGVVGPATWGTVPLPKSPAMTIQKSGPLIMIGSALVAGGLLAATLTPTRK